LAFFGISAACEAFSPTSKGLPIALDIHFVMIYLSYRWLKGKMAMMMHSQPQQQKTNFLFSKDFLRAIGINPEQVA
jgi:hypothetical protein